jgi:O-antigen ligase
MFGYGQMLLGMTSPAFLEAILGTIVKPYGNPSGRMASIFMYANILAIYLQVIFILALGFWLEELKQHLPFNHTNLQHFTDQYGTKAVNSPPEAGNSLPQIHLQGAVPKLRFIFLSLLVLTTGGALVMTSSRNSWTIALLAMLAFALYQGWKILVAGVMGFAGVILWSAFGVNPSKQWLRGIIPRFLWARLSDEMNPNRPTADLRETQWQFAAQLTSDRPIVGWGLRNFTQLYQAKTQFWLGHPHNLFLMLTAETGIPATLLFAGLVGWVMYKTVLILQAWSQVFAQEKPQDILEDRGLLYQQLDDKLDDRLIIFTYFLAFLSCVLFNLLDVSLFDIRVNLLGWFLLAAIAGIVHHYQGILLWHKLERTVPEKSDIEINSTGN